MTELVGLAGSPAALTSYGLILLIFGFVPGFLLRLIVKLYPRDDPRRQELVAELYAMPRVWRPMWVVQQFECGVFEGLGARRQGRRQSREEQNERPVISEQKPLVTDDDTTYDARLRFARDVVAYANSSGQWKKAYTIKLYKLENNKTACRSDSSWISEHRWINQYRIGE